jgi:16S rRNA (uracil1498-N3)-methyltransferase
MSPRLFTKHDLHSAAALSLDEKASHYLGRVLRSEVGDTVLLFNGSDGEWLARIESVSRRTIKVRVEKQRRAQASSSDLWLLFAPIKQGRIDWLVEKATELGASLLQPVMTERTVIARMNLERLASHTIEASEQCGRLDVPELKEAIPFADMLHAWPQERILIYGDETGSGVPIKSALAQLEPSAALALLVGPEGGFSPREFEQLKALPGSVGVGLGPRILRADTAVAAMLACVQAWCGDGNIQPSFAGVAHAG